MMTKQNLYKVLLVGLALFTTFSCSKHLVGVCGTPDCEVANKTNTRKSDKYVVVLSMDGFRYDYQTLAKTPNLDQMDKNSALAILR